MVGQSSSEAIQRWPNGLVWSPRPWSELGLHANIRSEAEASGPVSPRARAVCMSKTGAEVGRAQTDKERRTEPVRPRCLVRKFLIVDTCVPFFRTRFKCFTALALQRRPRMDGKRVFPCCKLESLMQLYGVLEVGTRAGQNGTPPRPRPSGPETMRHDARPRTIILCGTPLRPKMTCPRWRRDRHGHGKPTHRPISHKMIPRATSLRRGRGATQSV